ncbi:hypothetical protein J2W36_004635 [Variovorax ginsengisoli]|uniref:Uncharacterized protein n=1 Tax=Variovorax ginsengisoli TaxID=363844 RepID=A0ABT9SEZ8_9BURK|nr:hypothetical protein [Variovorax ginsengisoli]
MHKNGVGDEGDDGNEDNTCATTFKGQNRSNDTHESSTDFDARLYRQGKAAKIMIH